MSEPVVTISGQRVYPRGQEPKVGDTAEEPRANGAAARGVSATGVSSSGWTGGKNDSTFEAGLPFLAAFVAVILIAVAALLIARRGR